MKTKKELFGIELQVYLEASKKKGEILDSLVRQTGMWRKSIIRSFKRLRRRKHGSGGDSDFAGGFLKGD